MAVGTGRIALTRTPTVRGLMECAGHPADRLAEGSRVTVCIWWPMLVRAEGDIR